ncbi:MAG TPA: hypothetical protein VGK00_08735 [Anaerolineales bacterium]
MITEIVGANWKELNDKIRTWMDKRNATQSVKQDGKKGQFIEILQKRYGYTREQATSELDKHYSKIIFD